MTELAYNEKLIKPESKVVEMMVKMVDVVGVWELPKTLFGELFSN